MARIRTIKPEFYSSPGIEQVSPWARLLYIAMWNWADDTGRGKAEARELMGFAFPLDENMTIGEFRRFLGEVRRVFGVNFYKVDGRPYYSIPSWEKHQKIDKRSQSRWPAPEEGEAYEPDTNMPSELQEQSNSWVLGGHSADTRRTSGAGTGEQGNRGTEEKEDRSPVETETSLAAEPRKRGARKIAEHLNGTAHSPDAHTIARAYSDSCQTPIAGNTLAKIAQAVDSCLTSGIDRAQIEVGIHDWAASPMTAPSTIPDFVHKAANRPAAAAATSGVGKATTKAMGWANLGNQLAQQQSDALSVTTMKGITA